MPRSKEVKKSVADAVEEFLNVDRADHTRQNYAGHYQPSPAHSRARQLAEKLPFSTLLQVPTPEPPPAPPPKIIRLWDEEDVG